MTASVEFQAVDANSEIGLLNVPRHVAIIMDGNGRWAVRRGLPRTEGHRRGVKTLRAAVKHAQKRGISYLTLFSFSSENWSRPQQEVSFLIGLLRRFVHDDLAELVQANVKVRVIGSRENLDKSMQVLLNDAEEKTAHCTGLVLVIAFNYGARDEYVRAVRVLAERVEAGELNAADIVEDDVSACLDTKDIPDPDLIVRTGGEQRLSNFLLWQAAYAEFYFAPAPWPEFDSDAFDDALLAFSNRDRRYGGLSCDATGT
ncbi:Ditrans,polycis-undecaprenyl-diphosphate synthase ((2E,6E)-farnesyl-diphosphate specific) [Pseudovibrio axinellae]|uniref:Isoprenyl transferase n=1 Tax=Pseudovibrio axinellae TaxID=989403 RepID=A0A166B4K2_9HYPH|nr:isoprenyl transferase [Pseudovibrio axinellae]KZL21881.1 Ditrans,polycis-undecaprenyl-diphosphate synthase ((2E,6E)-farnesyl-diphosphate specific) [Pseudovibrio axinellae]SEQ82131.1 undecaprenyl diphosphate synthase [Pseudovibrio axinellae]